MQFLGKNGQIVCWRPPSGVGTPPPPSGKSWICHCNVSNCQKDVMYPIAHVPHRSCVKKMSSCQKDVKCQKVKHAENGGGSRKIMGHNEVYTY